jgi:hypothetical protein
MHYTLGIHQGDGAVKGGSAIWDPFHFPEQPLDAGSIVGGIASRADPRDAAKGLLPLGWNRRQWPTPPRDLATALALRRAFSVKVVPGFFHLNF